MYLCRPKKIMRISKPEWLKIQLPQGDTSAQVGAVVSGQRLHTICSSGLCPNRGDCWQRGTATFMIGGNVCTRSCKFCNVATGRPAPLDPHEPQRVAQSAQLLQLRHVVLTSVDRDDLDDLGAAHWAATIGAVRSLNPGITMEALVPDFQGKKNLLDVVIAARPEIISHNLETVRRLSKSVRSRATYELSLGVIAHVAASGLVAKSGLMLGLGETRDEVLETMHDLRSIGCHVLTIGQYLRPSKRNVEVVEYVPPTAFAEYAKHGAEMGFAHVESHPLARSSYRSERHLRI
jgi:lipoic acid synthetase